MECALALVQVSRVAVMIVCLALVIKHWALVLHLSHLNHAISFAHQSIDANHTMALLPRLSLKLIFPLLLLLPSVVLGLCLHIEDSDAFVKRYCEVEDHIYDY